MEFLLQWDHEVFVFINQKLQNPFFDFILPVIRNKYIWLPLYIWIITYILTSFSLYKSSYFLLFIVTAVAITDFTSGQLLKKYVQRERPCLEAGIENSVIKRVYCSSSHSFPSSHATNHFGLAFILIALIGRKKKNLSILLYTWAGLISFAQVYVGVHYPLDVIGGAILGVLLIKIYLATITPIIKNIEKKDEVIMAVSSI